MAVSQSSTYKKQRRNQQKTLTRESLFISEYVQVKYKDIYREAASLYNEINKKHSQKPDLRKTVEFRQWKNSLSIANGGPSSHVPRQKEYKYKRTNHRDIVLDTTTAEMATSAETPAESPVPTTSEENRQIDQRVAGMTMCLNIPLMQMPTHNTTLASQETVLEEGDQTLNPFTIDMDEGEQALTPSILDQVSPETMEKLIRELELDPNLKDIMDDVQNTIQQESNIEEELVGLTIDLPDLEDLLEEELQLW